MIARLPADRDGCQTRFLPAEPPQPGHDRRGAILLCHGRRPRPTRGRVHAGLEPRSPLAQALARAVGCCMAAHAGQNGVGGDSVSDSLGAPRRAATDGVVVEKGIEDDQEHEAGGARPDAGSANDRVGDNRPGRRNWRAGPNAAYPQGGSLLPSGFAQIAVVRQRDGSALPSPPTLRSPRQLSQLGEVIGGLASRHHGGMPGASSDPNGCLRTPRRIGGSSQRSSSSSSGPVTWTRAMTLSYLAR